MTHDFTKAKETSDRVRSAFNDASQANLTHVEVEISDLDQMLDDLNFLIDFYEGEQK